MHSVELLREAIDLAKQLGYALRQDWLGGSGGGACEIRGRKVLFLDVASGPADQLDQVLDALVRDPKALELPMSAALQGMLRVRRSA